MKNRLFVLLTALALGLFIPVSPSFAADPSAAATELKDLVAKVNAGIRDGKRTEAEQADNLKEFDALLAKHKGETSDDVAQILYMKAMLYVQIFKNSDKGAELIKQLQHDFPDTTPGKNAEKVLANLKEGAEAEKIQAALVPHAIFPDFDVKDLDGKPLSVAGYKGKVVMVDFWATWCGPCVGEVPNVVKTYEKYHDKGFEIIGISLDAEGDKDKLISFTKDHKMPWRQYYDGLHWQNKLAVKYGIRSIPATFLLDGEGKIIARDVRGPDLEPAVAKALGVN